MKPRRWHTESGNAMVEFILVGIGLVFMLFSLFEICRGVWIYTTLAHAIKAGTRYAVVHGKGCVTSPNNCALSSLTVQAVAQQIRNASPALDPARMTITTMSVPGNPITSGANCSVPSPPAGICLTTLLTNSNQFPTNAAGTSGNAGDLVTITATYRFNTFISMFWPGRGGVVRPFGRFDLPAIGQQKVEF